MSIVWSLSACPYSLNTICISIVWSLSAFPYSLVTVSMSIQSDHGQHVHSQISQHVCTVWSPSASLYSLIIKHVHTVWSLSACPYSLISQQHVHTVVSLSACLYSLISQHVHTVWSLSACPYSLITVTWSLSVCPSSLITVSMSKQSEHCQHVHTVSLLLQFLAQHTCTVWSQHYIFPTIIHGSWKSSISVFIRKFVGGMTEILFIFACPRHNQLPAFDVLQFWFTLIILGWTLLTMNNHRPLISFLYQIYLILLLLSVHRAYKWFLVVEVITIKVIYFKP